MKIDVSPKPFNTPNFVIVKSPGTESSHSYPLDCIDAETLSALCDDFRSEIFKKSGKKDPRLA